MKKILLPIMMLLCLSVQVFAQEVNITDDASNAMQEARYILNEIEGAGFGAAFFNDMMSDANEAFSKGNYDLALDKVQEIINRKGRAFRINDSIAILDIKVAELKTKGLETAKAEELLNLAKSVFKKEAFDDAETLISRIDKELDEIESEYTTVSVILSAARNNIAGIVRENWLLLLISAAVLSAAGLLAYIRFDLSLTKQRLADLELKKDILEGLMKKIEASYYKEQTIGKKEYEMSMQNYQDEITDIKGKMPTFRDKLKGGKISYIHSSVQSFHKITLLPKNIMKNLMKGARNIFNMRGTKDKKEKTKAKNTSLPKKSRKPVRL